MERKMIKKNICYFLLFSLNLFLFCQKMAPVSNINWKMLEKMWKNYVLYPTSENALKIYKILPNQVNNKNIQNDVTELIWKTLDVLDNQVNLKDLNSIKLGFKLILISDGGFTEDILVILGKTIRNNAKTFLEELHSNFGTIKVILPNLLLNFGQGFVDRPDMEIIETELRIEAINKVSDKSLSKVKNICLKILKEHLLILKK
jgi:hypothetical protein